MTMNTYRNPLILTLNFVMHNSLLQKKITNQNNFNFNKNKVDIFLKDLKNKIKHHIIY